MEIRWLGNSCVEIRSDKNIIVDPNYVVEPKEKFDYVLITHEHKDHIDREKLMKLNYENLLAPSYTIKEYDLEGKEVKPGMEVEGIKVLESWCRNAKESVSYYYQGILHAGDSSKFPSAEDIKVVFTACFPELYEEYVAEMQRLNPELVVPIHYDPKEKIKNAEGLKEKLEEKGIKCKIINVGERLSL
ncbi:MAG TPA: MBL fold metallo-hydrolase [Thermococcus sp.]|nr:MBL fold metallo-hydrolase [Thermococcus sp.]